MGDNEVTLADDRLLASWNSHDTEALLDGVADDIVWQDVGLPEPLHGKEAVNEYFQGWMTAFPDFQANPVNRVVGDDSVAVEVVFTGTNTGPMNMGDQTIPLPERPSPRRACTSQRFATASSPRCTPIPI